MLNWWSTFFLLRIRNLRVGNTKMLWKSWHLQKLRLQQQKIKKTSQYCLIDKPGKCREPKHHIVWFENMVAKSKTHKWIVLKLYKSFLLVSSLLSTSGLHHLIRHHGCFLVLKQKMCAEQITHCMLFEFFLNLFLCCNPFI